MITISWDIIAHGIYCLSLLLVVVVVVIQNIIIIINLLLFWNKKVRERERKEENSVGEMEINSCCCLSLFLLINPETNNIATHWIYIEMWKERALSNIDGIHHHHGCGCKAFISIFHFFLYSHPVSIWSKRKPTTFIQLTFYFIHSFVCLFFSHFLSIDYLEDWMSLYVMKKKMKLADYRKDFFFVFVLHK